MTTTTGRTSWHPVNLAQTSASAAMKSAEAKLVELDDLAKRLEVTCSEDPRPWTRTPDGVRHLGDLAVQSAVRGFGYAAAGGVLGGATTAIAAGTLGMVAVAPVRAAVASVRAGELGARLRDPVPTAKAWLVDAPRARLAEAPLETALTGIPSVVAAGGGAASALVFGPSIAGALVSAELVSGGLKLAGAGVQALRDPRDR